MLRVAIELVPHGDERRTRVLRSARRAGAVALVAAVLAEIARQERDVAVVYSVPPGA